MCFHMGGNIDLMISTCCTILRRACGVWVLSHVSERCQAEPAVGEAHSSLLKATLLPAETRRTWWPLQSQEKNSALGRQKDVLKSWVSLWISEANKQTHKWHFVLKGTWSVRCCGRDQKPLGVVCLSPLLTLPLSLGLDY